MDKCQDRGKKERRQWKKGWPKIEKFREVRKHAEKNRFQGMELWGRKVPLSPADERLLVEPTEKEIKEAEHLPYPNLLGVCQYPSAYTRLEMRFAMSVLSRHRTKWSVSHGYSTRKMGLRYSANLTEKELNI